MWDTQHSHSENWKSPCWKRSLGGCHLRGKVIKIFTMCRVTQYAIICHSAKKRGIHYTSVKHYVKFIDAVTQDHK